VWAEFDGHHQLLTHEKGGWISVINNGGYSHTHLPPSTAITCVG